MSTVDTTICTNRMSFGECVPVFSIDGETEYDVWYADGMETIHITLKGELEIVETLSWDDWLEILGEGTLLEDPFRMLINW